MVAVRDRDTYNRRETETDLARSVHVVVSEGMELIIVLLVILANLVGLVFIQKWSGLT
jgi:hypothetical protein